MTRHAMKYTNTQCIIKLGSIPKATISRTNHQKYSQDPIEEFASTKDRLFRILLNLPNGESLFIPL